MTKCLNCNGTGEVFAEFSLEPVITQCMMCWGKGSVHPECINLSGWCSRRPHDPPKTVVINAEHGKIEGNNYGFSKRSQQCTVCGTLTGVHGFSFDKKDR